MKASEGHAPSVLQFLVIEKRGGGWHPVTGGVEKGEEFLEAAKRELEEETGFSQAGGEWVDLRFSYRFEGRFGPAEEHAFGFILKDESEPALDPGEHLACRWVGLQEARKSLSFQPQKDALDLFSCYLR